MFLGVIDPQEDWGIETRDGCLDPLAAGSSDVLRPVCIRFKHQASIILAAERNAVVANITRHLKIEMKYQEPLKSNYNVSPRSDANLA